MRCDQSPRENWQEKCYKLRKLVAGDYSDYVGGGNDAEEEENRTTERKKRFPEVLVRQLETGRTNQLFTAVKTLHQQAAFRRPAISFDGLDSDESAFMESYFATRTGPIPYGCNVVTQMQQALMAYLVDGVGWVGLVFDKYGKLAIQHFDSLDVIWDRGPALIQDAKWAAVIDRKPASFWAELFKGYPGVKDALRSVNDDKPVEMAFYYDCEGDFGTYAVVPAYGENGFGDTPILVEESPFYVDIAGYRQPFLPLEAACFQQMPSMAYPVGMVENAIPHQFALMTCEKYIRDAIMNGKPLTLINPAAFSEDDLKAIERGDISPLIKLKADGAQEMASAIMRVQGTDVPVSVLNYRNMQDQAITAQTGVNPYATGDKVDGIQYASEVNAIQQSANLTAATVARDHALHWEGITSKYIKAASVHDDAPLQMFFDGEWFEFGPQMPVRELLRAEATPVARQDTLRHQSEPEEMAKNAQLLQTALSMAGQFPNALPEAFSEYLRSAGVVNVKDWMEQPAALNDPMDGPVEAPGVMTN